MLRLFPALRVTRQRISALQGILLFSAVIEISWQSVFPSFPCERLRIAIRLPTEGVPKTSCLLPFLLNYAYILWPLGPSGRSSPLAASPSLSEYSVQPALSEPSSATSPASTA